MQAVGDYMPPPKKPKSDVHWTTLCAEAQRSMPDGYCSDDDVGSRSTSVNDSVATWNSDPLTSPPAVASECLGDRRRSDDASCRQATDDVRPSGSQQPMSSLTSLRRLLLEPATAASDLRPSAATSSTTSSASAAHVVEVPTPCPQSLSNVGLRSQSVAVPTAAADGRPNDGGPDKSLPSAALRRILLNEEVADYSDRHPKPPADCFLLRQDRRAVSARDVDRSLDSTSPVSAVGCAASHQSDSSCDDRRRLPTALSLAASYSQLTSRIQSRDSGTSDQESKYSADRSLQ